ncbi:uncharacterized protein [Asterias amurensis]|uniref:uncharacterized protein n=1 Tax=Asterias amurensis TaxID=7602 RepID=UPI003AB31A9F
MVRKRKNDPDKDKNDVGQGNSPKQRQQRPDETSKSTAEEMQFVSNSRSRTRLGSAVPSTGTLRWLCRLRIVRLFVVTLVVGSIGFAAGRFVHQKMYFGEIRVRLTDSDTEPDKNVKVGPYLHTDYHDGVLMKRFGASKYDDDDPRHVQSMKDLKERHAASRNKFEFEKQINNNINNQNLPNVHVNHQKQHPAAKQQQASQPEEAKQQHAPHQQAAHQQQAAQTQHGANQPAALPQQQHAAKQQQAANQQNNVQQPALPLQQPIKLPQGVAAQQAKPAQQQPVAHQQGVQKQSSDLHPKKPQVHDLPSDVDNYPYHIIQSLTNTHKMPHLKQRFIDCTKSILDKASINLHFFFVVDNPGREFITETLQKITDEGVAKNEFQFHFMDVEELAQQIAPLVSMLQAKVSKGNPYYQDAIFFLSVALHRGILPDYVHKVIMLDTDLKFMTDIKELFDHFEHFVGDNIMGLAREMQPVYRHMLSYYRNLNKGTKAGDPPPNGLTGFNSGVFLLDFDKIKRSTAYHSYINPDKIVELTSKYYFKGHLGDQDFYSLISLDKPDLFYILPCSWNRQLCTWWKDKGYTDVFDQYFTCNEKIHVYHGNCNTPIPH